ncbi:MAG: OmpA family protein [Cytophagaceae bacterium]
MRIVLFFLLFSLSCKGIAQSTDKLLGKAEKLFSEKNYFQAINFYEQALLEKKDDPLINFKIAQCYLYTGPKTKALPYARLAVTKSEKPGPEMYFAYAQALHLNHNFDEAIDAYKKSDPGNTNKKAISKYIQECQYGKEFVSKAKNYKITNAGLINSQHAEYLPHILPDLSKMYFTSRRPGSTGGKAEYDGAPFEDIYMSVNKGGAWDTPLNLGSPLNSDIHDACIGLSPSGEIMFVYKSSNGGDIYQSELKGNKWTKPEPMPFNTEFFETAACLSPDERTLIFVRAQNAFSNRDIYMCTRTIGGKWSAPRKVDGINTPYDEDAPFMHPDGKTLYFSSKGHNSMGGYDIFKVTKRADGGWSAPENLGYPINTAGDDVYFVLSADGKVGFYASDKEGGLGKHDIYSIRMPVEEGSPQLALLKGKVKDENGKPVDADITVTDNQTKEVIATFISNSATGEYMVSLPSGKNYGVTVEKKGKLFYSENIYLTDKDGYKEINSEITLEPVKTGAKIILKNIFFDTGKDELRPESLSELQRLVNLLKENPSIKIEISGHTDNIGNSELNQKLSERRAKNVVDFLIKSGIPAARLNAIGYGSSKPVADNNTEEGRQRNRRTEFKIL